MKLNPYKPTISADGEYEAHIDASAQGLIMDMLAKLYNDPMSACIREYVSNAVDVHRESGSTQPVRVHLPTFTDNRLIVRDYGRGLSAADVMAVFGNFGTSTKRDTDELIGGFGIGSKSGLAVCDEVHVTSVKNHRLCEFTLARRKDNVIVTRFDIQDTDADDRESGTRIELRPSPAHIPYGLTELKHRHLNVLGGWSATDVVVDPEPTLSATQSEQQLLATYLNENRICDTWHAWKHGYTRSHRVTRNGMTLSLKTDLIHNGCLVNGVLYTPVNLSALDNSYAWQDYNTKCFVTEFFRSNDVVLNLDMAQTKVTYQREDLDLSDEQCAAHIISRAEQLCAEITSAAKRLQTETSSATDYVKRMTALGIDLSELATPCDTILAIYDGKELNCDITRSDNYYGQGTITTNDCKRFSINDAQAAVPRSLSLSLPQTAYTNSLLICAQPKEMHLKQTTTQRKLTAMLSTALELGDYRYADYPALAAMKHYVSTIHNAGLNGDIMVVSPTTLQQMSYRNLSPQLLDFDELMREYKRLTRSDTASDAGAQTGERPSLASNIYSIGVRTRHITATSIEDISYTGEDLLVIAYDCDFAFTTRGVRNHMKNASADIKLLLDALRRVYGYTHVVCPKTKSAQNALARAASNAANRLSVTIVDCDQLADYIHRVLADYGYLTGPTYEFLLSVRHDKDYDDLFPQSDRIDSICDMLNAMRRIAHLPAEDIGTLKGSPFTLHVNIANSHVSATNRLLVEGSVAAHPQTQIEITLKTLRILSEQFMTPDYFDADDIRAMAKTVAEIYKEDIKHIISIDQAPDLKRCVPPIPAN